MKILLVGEKVNSKVSNKPFDRRFNSGAYLHSALLEIKLIYPIEIDTIVHLDNAIMNGKINKRLKVKSLQYDKIITLGNIADKILNKLEINHKTIVHPAFHKRFRSKEGIKGYAKLLEDVIYD